MDKMFGKFTFKGKALNNIQSVKANNDKNKPGNIWINSISLGHTVSELSLMQHVISILIHLSDILLCVSHKQYN